MSWSNVPVWATLFIAIVSPVITAIVTNRHNRKMLKLQQNHDVYMRRIDNYEMNKIRIFEEYVASISYLLTQKLASSDAWRKFQELHGKAYIYASEPTRKLMDRIYPYTGSGKAADTLSEICKSISMNDISPLAYEVDYRPQHPRAS